jgi:hypothetical protein
LIRAGKSAIFGAKVEGFGMRYVIAICVVTCFAIWDIGANDSHYIRKTVVELKRIVSMVGM